MIGRVRLEAATRALGESLDELLPKMIGVGERVGFCLVAFDFGDKGNFSYCSNSQRQDMIKLLEEFLAYQKAGLMTDPKGPRAEG